MRTILVFGTFDCLHEGHIHFFKQAKTLGDRLIVLVSRDDNVYKLKKRTPVQTEHERLAALQTFSYIDEVHLCDASLGSFQMVLQTKPTVIALGYDQKDLKQALISWLTKHPFLKIQIITLAPYKEAIFKSSKLYHLRNEPK